MLDYSPIRTLADFKGTTIGELTLGQPGEIYTSVMLAGAGLHKGDYSFAPIGTARRRSRRSPAARSTASRFPSPELRIYESTAHLKFRYFYQPILSDIPDDALRRLARDDRERRATC